MKIILPHKTKSIKVTDYRQIKKDAEEMLGLLNAGKFKGKWAEGLALSHAQVCDKPYAFFVSHKSWEGNIPEIVINPRIIEKFEPVPLKLEACVSFPFRDIIKTQRFWRIVAEFEVPAGIFHSNRMKTEQLAFDGLAAVVFQHELDHHHGEDIYTKFKK